MSDEVEGVSPDIEAGQVYEDAMMGGEYRVKYVDEDVVLLCDNESEHNHLYNTEYFKRSTSKTLLNPDTRFKLQNGSEQHWNPNFG